MKRGAVFTPASFKNLGSPAQITNTLTTLVKNETIRKLGHGVYYYPKYTQSDVEQPPDPYKIAKSIADGCGHTLLISEKEAAYTLGLIYKPPDQAIYLTDGPSRERSFGSQSVYFRQVIKKTLVGAEQKSGIVFQALRYLGNGNVTSQVVDKIRSNLSAKDKKQILRDYRLTPIWMHEILKNLAK